MRIQDEYNYKPQKKNFKNQLFNVTHHHGGVWREIEPFQLKMNQRMIQEAAQAEDVWDLINPNHEGELNEDGENKRPLEEKLSAEDEVKDRIKLLEKNCEKVFNTETENFEEKSNPWIVNFKKTNIWRNRNEGDFEEAIQPNIPCYKLEREFVKIKERESNNSNKRSKTGGFDKESETEGWLDLQEEYLNLEENVVYSRTNKIIRLYEAGGLTPLEIGSARPKARMDVLRKKRYSSEI